MNQDTRNKLSKKNEWKSITAEEAVIRFHNPARTKKTQVKYFERVFAIDQVESPEAEVASIAKHFEMCIPASSLYPRVPGKSGARNFSVIKPANARREVKRESPIFPE